MGIAGSLGVVLVLYSSLAVQDETAETEVGAALVAAIAADDIVAYSQCWTSARWSFATAKEYGVELPAAEAEKMRDYIQLRNKSIAESFQKIQSLINEQEIDRQMIRLKTCEARAVRERKAPNGTFRQAGGFSIEISAEAEEWQLEIDDAVMDRGIWHFTDSPRYLRDLRAGETILSFPIPTIR